MSDNNKAPKIYVNAMWFEQKTFDDGGSILKVNTKVDEMIKFLKDHKDENGYVKIVISKRKEVGEKGQTHFATLDTWRPDGSKQSTPKTAVAKPVKNPEPVEEDI